MTPVQVWRATCQSRQFQSQTGEREAVDQFEKNEEQKIEKKVKVPTFFEVGPALSPLQKWPQ